MSAPPLWLVEQAGVQIYILGGGPSSTEWSSPAIERLVAESEAFWSEAPEIGTEDLPLLQVYGIDADSPLETWLSPEELSRVEDAAEKLEIARATLVPLRPWLAAQVIKIANDSKAGFRSEFAPEMRLAAIARERGIPVKSEFGSTETLFATFSTWPREAEVQRLMSTVDEVERGPEFSLVVGEEWRKGELTRVETLDASMNERYPALHETLIVQRNEAWVQRIRGMLDEGTRSFIVLGTGHVVGPQGLIALLGRTGISARRIDVGLDA